MCTLLLSALHVSFSLSLCYLCAIYMLMLGTGFCSMLSLCYLCAIYAISCWGLLFALCYLCAISVLSMLSHAGGYFLRYAISVLSLCYLCYLMLSLCYLCAISLLSLLFWLKAMYVYYMNVGRNGFHLLMYLCSISKKGNTMNY